MRVERVKEYLDTIDKVIEDGVYKDDWSSLQRYREPEWYRNAKFGIFIHWGVYSVPAFSSEWYARNMYRKGSKEYEHHIKTYGSHKEFGYKDFIPMFKAEKFDAGEWTDLFVKSGARYFMPVAEHHDGFQMYRSELSEWNAYEKGPKRDVLRELKREGESRGLVFCASSHRAENYWFFSGAQEFDSGIEGGEYQEPYGYRDEAFNRLVTKDGHQQVLETQKLRGKEPTKEHLDDWLARTCEIVDRYKPKVVWFDWWIQNLAFKPYLKKFAAYYYNRAIEWGEEVAINYKEEAFALGTAVFDVERGQLAEIRPRLWQTDTAVAKNSWSYSEGNDYKKPEAIVGDLVDIVSKNGCMLLNIGPKADGTIPKEDRDILLSIGEWLEVNGEGIYDTTYWSTYGEGPTEIIEGTFADIKREGFTHEDIRFTYKAPYIYAYVMRWPEDNSVKIKSLATPVTTIEKVGSKYFKGDIQEIEVLGYDTKIKMNQDKEGLKLSVEGDIDTKYPVCLKIKID